MSARWHRGVAAAVAVALVQPAHAGLSFSQIPPASVRPPAPNVIVTLDDSLSMGVGVAFDSNQTYPVPRDHAGNWLDPNLMDPAWTALYNETWMDGYKLGLTNDTQQADLWNGTINGTPSTSLNSYVAAYKALPASQRPAYLRWFGFYRTRLLAMRASVMNTFNATSIPDGQIRLAWQGLIGSCRSGFGPSSGCSASGTSLDNGMWPLDNVTGGRNHRANFFKWVQGAPLALSTPTRSAYVQAGEYLRQTGKDSPWAHLPGTTQLPELACRRAYQVLFTDGEWTSGAAWDAYENVAASLYSVNDDNVNTVLPDTTSYAQQPPYKGAATGGSGSLADLAFKYWATDLQTGQNFGNELRPLMPVPTSQTFGGVTVEPYWNPANNPATWQHMVTFAIGFGSAANIATPKWEGSTFAGSDFANIVAGTSDWPNIASSAGRRADLWHAAINSRGRMFAAADQQGLDQAFRSILGEIVSQNATAGGAASSYLVSGTQFRLVRAGYSSEPTLRGTLEGFGLDSAGALSNTPIWSAQEQVAKVLPANRVVLTAKTPSSGEAFRWNKISDWQKSMLNQSAGGSADGAGSNRLDYLRGDSSNEATTANPSGAFRDRKGALLGTIVNAEPKVVAAARSGYTFSGYPTFRTGTQTRTPVAYVGANDGMLHGFNTNDGTPVLSYVPRGVFPFLSTYSDKAHVHRMYVDGPLITADWLDGTTWRTLLVGALGAGGRGFFGLEVTNPQDFTEAKAATLVRFDYTAPPVGHPSLTAFKSESGSTGMMGEIDTDLGHITADPSRDAFLGRNLQVTRMRNGKWALLLGNGANSVNERAVLYIVYLDGSGFKRLITETATGTGNGLSTPLPVDLNNDGLVDFAYAGDLRGRMWKFDLSSSDDANWKVAQVDGVNTPLIDTGRPITSAPAVAVHPKGGLLVTFGSGRLLTDDDRSATTTEYLYGVQDKEPADKVLQATDSSLVARTLAAETATIAGSNIAARVLSSTSAPVDYSTKRGWRIALGQSKERVVFNPIVQGRLVYYSTTVPTVATACTVQQGGGSLLTFDVIDGAQPANTVVDINGDGLFTSADKITDKDVMGRGAGVGRLIGLFEAPPGSGASTACSGDMIMGASGMICAKKPPGPGRRAWRDMRP